jgi:hypothetical protein
MKCDRLITLIKGWYLKVQEEAMAPARMVAFMEKHISQCEECLADPDVQQEADKIREIVLPPSKALKPKVVRVPKEDVEDAVDTEKVEDETTEDDDEVIKTDADEDADDDEDEDEDSFDPDIMDEEEEI